MNIGNKILIFSGIVYFTLLLSGYFGDFTFSIKERVHIMLLNLILVGLGIDIGYKLSEMKIKEEKIIG